ncbi:hypothetical protein SAMN02746065_1273 [Desulfocicer vacuolatum DSM 3385]|uniref:PAS domain-containing protein n=1 Tax=Desulfocicer vacuolatum DSM 3385 TaxID=1121400 RepID=A0A1W2E979_9BACT|nr:hypothetical protein [Desulfocicer vacuolatum]SMD06215.1 hypothetical protein SAMN02746065_1273 [Desulfocicer vacuolatum DSM 3385]
MDIEQITDTDDFILLREIVNRLPWGIVVIDHALNVQYMNPRFQEIFDPPLTKQLPMDRGTSPGCLGHILGCKYNGSTDHLEGKGPCRHCELRLPSDTLAALTSSKGNALEGKYTVVKEFRIHGKNILKYLEIRHVPLMDQRVMILVKDCTQKALARLNEMEDSSHRG